MVEAACGPFTNGFISGEVASNILPENQNFTSYPDRECGTARPNRERIREEISDYVLLMLGAPVVRIELDIQQLTLAVDEALKRFEEEAPRYYFSYYHFTTVPNEARYKLPCDVGWIRKVNYLTEGEFCSSKELGGVYAFATPFGAYGGFSWGSFTPSYPFWGNLGEWHLFKGYQELFNRVTSNEGGYEIRSDNTIYLYPNPRREHQVTVEYIQRQKDWSYIDTWVKDYALALAKIMVGRVRSKYERFVSPGGGVALDGGRLIEEGHGEKEKLEQKLIDRYAVTHYLPIVG